MTMNEHERLKGFQQGLAQLQQQYGITLKADIQAEQLGDAILTRPVLQAIPAPDWQPDIAQTAMQNGVAEVEQ